MLSEHCSFLGLAIGIFPDLFSGKPLKALISSVGTIRFVAAVLWLGGAGLAVFSGLANLVHARQPASSSKRVMDQ